MNPINGFGQHRAVRDDASTGGRGQRTMMAFLLIVGFVAGIVVGRGSFLSQGDAGASSSLADLPEYETLQQTWDLIHDQYVDQASVSDQALIYGAAKGMADALGDTGHTTFLDPFETRLFIESQSGEFVGIGIQLDYSEDQPTIEYPLADSPAEKAGLRTGDVIVEVDGMSTDGMSETQVGTLLVGDEGTDVQLTIERPADSSVFSVTLTRERIPLETATWTMLPGNVAHVRFPQFYAGVTKSLKTTLTAAREAGAVAIVLDLRNNPGGLVQEEIGVASQFLPKGSPLYLYQKSGEEPKPVRAVGGGIATDLPLAVLINGGTASAAEILAVAIQENGRGHLFGEQTFGTGTVLTPMPLEGDTMLLLGTAFWLSPDGDRVWHKGVDPDTEVTLPQGQQPTRPVDNTGITADELARSPDAQLLAAYQSLVDGLSSVGDEA